MYLALQIFEKYEVVERALVTSRAMGIILVVIGSIDLKTLFHAYRDFCSFSNTSFIFKVPKIMKAWTIDDIDQILGIL